MASITYDGQSFMLDGRRIWLVSGSINYARVPRELWADRIHAARQAGLNCIETPVFWARHEARQGQFDFKGDNDLRHFVELLQQVNMYCILRPGPYVGSGWDTGGLPPWLQGVPNIRLRVNSQPFLEACSRYITAVAQQVRDLQATGSGSGGPIVLIQNEHAWTCGHDELAHAYLGELNRYYRESGLTVPTINANDLWQSVEGEIDCWTGFEDLLSHLRQLAMVKPEQPRLVIDFKAGRSDVWGRELTGTRSPEAVLRRLAEVLAAGGQYNISPFHGGTNFGFSGGRLAGEPAAYITASSDRGAPLTELGRPGPAYSPVRRISTFASRFGRVLSHLDPRRQAAILHPGAAASRTLEGAGGKGVAAKDVAAVCAPALSVVHASGSQGGVAFVFGDESGKSRSQPSTLLLADGSVLPIDLGSQPVGWYLMDTRLTGRAHLDYTNLCALGCVGRTLVSFGPAGTRGVVSINGSPAEMEVPRGKSPLVLEHEGMTLVVASVEQADTIFFDGETVLLGIVGIDRHGAVIPFPEQKTFQRINSEGETTTHKVTAHAPAPPPRAHAGKGTPAKKSKTAAHVKLGLGEWEAAPTGDYTRGESARFATIAGPSSLGSLGAPYGYGWYRLRIKSSETRRHHVLFPGSGDRLHLTLDGEPEGVVGQGPGAEPEGSLQLKKGTHTLVVLAENLGRPSAGAELGQAAGILGHAWSVSPVRTEKPRLVAADPVDILAFRSPLWHVHKGDVTDATRMTWTIAHRRKTGLAVRIAPLEGPGIVLLNNDTVHYFERGTPSTLMFDAEKLSRGNNTLQVAMVSSTEGHAPELSHAVTVLECEDSLTAKAEWAFARWEPPGADAYGKPGRGGSGPCWWRCSLMADESDVPLMLQVEGLTKGQIYLNKRHLGRYWVATADGKRVPPQIRYHIPRPWLEAGERNELLIFEEHGGSPARCRIIADAAASAFGD
jgi:hypothetical protein